MSEQGVYEKARAAFDAFAHIAPNDPNNAVFMAHCDEHAPWRALQIRLAAWRTRNFGLSGNDAMGLGEEVGEVALPLLGMALGSGKILHATLKTDQQIRGFSDPEKGRAAISDGVADAIVFAIQVCTSMRLDFHTLIFETATEVMNRDWTKNRVSADKGKQFCEVVVGGVMCGHGINQDGTCLVGHTPDNKRPMPMQVPLPQGPDVVRHRPDAKPVPEPLPDEQVRWEEEKPLSPPLIVDHEFKPNTWPARDECDRKITDNGERARQCGRPKREHRA